MSSPFDETELIPVLRSDGSRADLDPPAEPAAAPVAPVVRDEGSPADEVDPPSASDVTELIPVVRDAGSLPGPKPSGAFDMTGFVQAIREASRRPDPLPSTASEVTELIPVIRDTGPRVEPDPPAVPDAADFIPALRSDTLQADQGPSSAPRPESSPGRPGRARFQIPQFPVNNWSVMVTVVVAAVVFAYGAWSVPSVRTVLRQSFTQLPAAYTELFFTRSPSLNGTTLLVPVTVEVHSAAASSLTLKVWLVDGAGVTDATTSVRLTPQGGAAAAVVSLQVPGDAEVVFVSVAGQTQTLHYRIAGSPIPTSAGTPAP